MKYTEKEVEPIPLLEDWLRNDDETGGFVCENGDFERGKDEQDDE